MLSALLARYIKDREAASNADIQVLIAAALASKTGAAMEVLLGVSLRPEFQ